MSNIQFKQQTLESAFEQFYIVPDYQREYVWGEEEVIKLLEDTYDEYRHDKTKEYYIGSTVVFRNHDGIYELIDGQQRTTTLFLMVAAFKKVYELNKADNSVFESMLAKNYFSPNGITARRNRIVLQYLGSNDVLTGIIKGEATKIAGSKSSERIVDAYGTIEEWLCQNMGFEKLQEFFIYCLRKVVFIQIETLDLSRALKIFETINERGVGLNSMDLLKNLIFRKASASDYGYIKVEWETIVRTLELNKENPLRFLRYFIISNYDNPTSSSKIIREDEIYSWFVNNEKEWDFSGDFHKVMGFIKDNVNFYIKCYSGVDKGVGSGVLENIKYLGGSAYRQHLMLMLAARHMPFEHFLHFARQIEVLIFIYTVIKKNNRDWEFIFSGMTASIRKIQCESDLNDFIKNKLIPIYEDNKAGYRESFMMLGTDYLNKSKIRYILGKFSAYIDGLRSNGEGRVAIAPFMEKKIEIEHIIPMEMARHSLDMNIQKTVKRIGNLALLEKSINASISNGDPVVIKMAAYEKSSIYFTRSISKIESVGVNTNVNRANELLQSFSDWNLESINERQAMMYDLSLRIWRFELL